MSTDTIIEQLREEVAALRKEVAQLRSEREVHHHYHGAPMPFYQLPVYDPNRAPAPTYPWVVTCAADPTPGSAVGGFAPVIGGCAPRID